MTIIRATCEKLFDMAFARARARRTRGTPGHVTLLHKSNAPRSNVLMEKWRVQRLKVVTVYIVLRDLPRDFGQDALGMVLRPPALLLGHHLLDGADGDQRGFQKLAHELTKSTVSRR